MLTPARLAMARSRRGLSATDLATKANLSVRSISDYERGRRQASAPTTESLTVALGFPPEFLMAPDPPELPEESVVFRKKLTSRSKAAALSAGQLAIEFNAWLERTFTLPRPDVPTLEHPDAETAADMVRARWGLGSRPAPNMVQLLESRGVRVFSTDCHDVDAFSFWHQRTPYVFLNPATTPERARFDAAHELGRLAATDAKAFASAFLLPRKGLLATVPRGAVTEQVLGHRTRWHVDALTLTYRLRDVGLLTAAQYRELCVTLSREPAAMRHREMSRLFRTVFRVVGPRQVARELRLGVEELNSLVSGLVLTVV